jgi:O-methyltransferase
VTAAELYLDLLKKSLTRYGVDGLRPYRPASRRGRLLSRTLRQRFGLELARRETFDPELRAEGRDWPFDAETMIGLRRLDNLQQCVTNVVRDRIPGDLIETGVWRGGAAILMRAVLAAHGETDRMVWVADSFAGLPPPDPDRFPLDARDDHWQHQALAISQDEVAGNFRRYGLLDEQVRFLPGWFRDTLPSAPIDRLAVLRLDGDMYESTIVALESLYPKLAVGGYAIVDDYRSHPACKAAVDDYRKAHSIDDAIEVIDWAGVFWRRSG